MFLTQVIKNRTLNEQIGILADLESDMLTFVRNNSPEGLTGVFQDAAGLVAICVLLVAGLGLPALS